MYYTYKNTGSAGSDPADRVEEVFEKTKIDERGHTHADQLPPKKQTGIFDMFSGDDLIIFIILLTLMNENCEDKALLTILILLLFI